MVILRQSGNRTKACYINCRREPAFNRKGGRLVQLPKDPYILVSLINTKLRDFYADPEDLCKSLGLDQNQLEQTLSAAGFRYDPDTNQYRP